MPLRAGIVGLPNVGKSSLFNALTKAGAAAANYPFCTIDPNVGVVEVPDERLDALSKIVKPQRVVPAAVEFVDIAGLVKGASQGEGLGNQFLGHIREVDAVVHVVRCFEDENVTHVHGKINPVSDIGVIDLELIYADLDSAERQKKKIEKEARADKKQQPRVDLLNKIIGDLQAGKAVRNALSPAELLDAKEFFFLTAKPVIYCCNVAEGDVAKADELEFVKQVRAHAATEKAEVVTISAKVESEIAVLEGEERDMFLNELGLKETGLSRLAHSVYKLLGLMSYFTAGEKEVRAWTIHRGDKAPQAAGVIHTDFEKGFIRAEVIAFDDLIACGTQGKAREAGKLRLEGKEYVMRDGDVCEFRFSV